jgi:hypothetical protein
MTVQNSLRRPTLVRPRDRELLSEIEPHLNEAAYLATALTMATFGIGRTDVDDKCEREAIGWLASQVHTAAHKARETWNQAYYGDSGNDAA